jgi:hypothetical protein
MTDVLWAAPEPTGDEPLVHALVIGVSSYDHLGGGPGPLTDEPILAGLGQLSAAATSASRVALWLRDHFEFPSVRLGSVRLLASPSPGELPLPEGVTPPPATFDEVGRAVAAWRAAARSRADNVTLMYVAGHGIQTSNEGGILLLADVGSPDSLTALQRAVDVASLRRGMVADPARAATATPAVQYYFYDACRVLPPASDAYVALAAGVSLDEPKGVAAATSWVVWGSRSRDYALADAGTRTTLFSKAFTEVLETGAPADPDGRTVRFARFGEAMELAVDQLAAEFGEQQTVLPGGAGKLTTPVYLRPPVAWTGGPGVVGGGGVAVDLQAGIVVEGGVVIGVDLGGGETAPAASEVTPRSVVVRTDDAQRRALTITDAAGAVVAEGATDEPIELPAGDLRATIQMPWGGTVTADMTVPELGEVPDVTVHVPQQSVRSVADAPRLDRQLGPTGGGRSGWCLRFLTWTPAGLVRVADATPPGVEVDDVEDDGVAIIMHANGSVLQYAQIRTDDGRSLVVALPILMAAEFQTACWLHVRVSGDALGAVVRFFDQQKDAVAGYLLGGRPDHAAALATAAETFEGMLMAKMRDPVGAALGGYALLRLNELDRMHDWPFNLAEIFDWLPDGAVIAGELAARRGDDVRAAEWFGRAAARGLPLFSDGLSVLANRVPQLVVDDDLPAGAQRDLRTQAEPLLALSPTADFRALASTLRADLDRGEITAERGWRRFGRTGPVRDPRDFWSEP